MTLSLDNPTASDLDSGRAWLVAVAASLAVGVAFGTIYTFGTFFEAMSDEFGVGLGPTSIVFSLTAFLFFGTGAITGRLADRWGARPLVWIGGALFAGGLLATSTVDELWQGYLTYGFGAGFGGGMFLSPLFAVVAAWFERYRAIAQGLVATGSGLGTLTLSPLAERLIADQGWREAYTVLGIVCAVAFAVSGLFIAKPPVAQPPNPGAHVGAVLRSSNFRWLALGAAMQSASMISAFAFIVPFSKENGVSAATAALLVGVIGAASIGGRLFLTGASDRFGPVRTLQWCLLAHPVAFTIWLLAGGNVAVLFVFVAILGVAYGGFVALVGVVTAHLFGTRGIGSIMGLAYLSAGVGSLIYPPVVGVLTDNTDGPTIPILAIIVASVGAVVAILRVDAGSGPQPIGA